ncbi:CoB--CoM heterodisulfide reductase iron-sulfur subunit B family protein [candidate division WOR-3 bacterium]|nr:CoB--CoM heterodisulfide reductase iron-sulfur subunit B family protein [candidate division WOR-3 bacterium]
MKVSYYPGCTLKTKARNFETSALAVAEKLGIELIELSRWNCCGTVFSLTDDDLIHHVAPIRNLIRVQEMNKNGLVENDHRLVTLCSMCYNTLKRANIRVKEKPDDLKKINDFMYLEEDYKGNVEVIHFLELIKDIGFEKIKENVTNPFKGLKIAPYYGCMLLRPKEVGIDDPEEPVIQEELISALGAEVIDNPYKKVCCGSYQTIRDKQVVSNLAYDILTHAQNAGAEAISLSCPLCAFNLDSRQKEIKEKHSDFTRIPVFYFTQLMAIGFGLNEDYYGFDLNYVNPEPLLKEKNLIGRNNAK